MPTTLTRRQAQTQRVEILIVRDRDGFSPTSVSKPLERVTAEWLGREVMEFIDDARTYREPHSVTVRVT